MSSPAPPSAPPTRSFPLRAACRARAKTAPTLVVEPPPAAPPSPSAGGRILTNSMVRSPCFAHKTTEPPYTTPGTRPGIFAFWSGMTNVKAYGGGPSTLRKISTAGPSLPPSISTATGAVAPRPMKEAERSTSLPPWPQRTSSQRASRTPSCPASSSPLPPSSHEKTTTMRSSAATHACAGLLPEFLADCRETTALGREMLLPCLAEEIGTEPMTVSEDMS
mmetsp:Transcript_104457/g.280651  ORF Transcript_104457/g.280651 Transcript_104457/m.280651 type:complete len:221 (+) Transcript_104457:1446-2108(+)